MNLDETATQITLIGERCEQAATALGNAHALPRLYEALSGIARSMRTYQADEGTIAPLLRTAAETLEPWAVGPRSGMTVAVACLMVAADHAELGGTVTNGQIIAEQLAVFVESLLT
jgi:hypothetical protein